MQRGTSRGKSGQNCLNPYQFIQRDIKCFGNFNQCPDPNIALTKLNLVYGAPGQVGLIPKIILGKTFFLSCLCNSFSQSY